MRKHNHFVIFYKKINLFITNLLEKYLNKLSISNLAKNKSNIITSNRVFLSLVMIIILFLSYLSIPHTYNKVKIRNELKNQLLDKFSTNFIFSQNFNYKFLPRPHFIIEDSIILKNQTKISEVRKLKIYVSLANLFFLKNIKVKDVILENTNFYFNKKNYNFFLKLLDNNFLKSSFKIKNSNIFYRNIEDEVLFINKIKDMKYYFDPNDLQNVVFSKNEIFNISYSYKLINDKIEKKIYSKINLNFLKLQIENELSYIDDIKIGSANFIFNQNKSKASYEVKENYFTFTFFDKLSDPNFIYKGQFNFNPFYSNLEGKVNKMSLSTLIDTNGLFAQLLKTKILNNENLNINLRISGNKIKQSINFVKVILNSRIKEGLIDLDNTKFSWKNNTHFEILDSLIYVNKNQVIFDGKLIIDITEPSEVYKYLLTPKKYRSEIKKIEFNYNYNFDQKTMSLSNVKINNQVNQKVNEILKDLIFKDHKLQNKAYFKMILNKAIKSYAG